MLHLRVIFAERTHARIVSLRVDRALAYPGVVAVLTAKDVPYNRYGLVESDQPVLCENEVHFEGDKVALVVAETSEAAAAGGSLVVVEYEDLPAVTDAESALLAGAPLVHSDRSSNVLFHMPIRKGDTTHAFQESDVVIEDEFTTSWQEHAFLQPEAGIAWINPEGQVIIETAGQWLHEDRRQIAEILQIPPEQVIVRYAVIGGAFGGREDLSIQHLLALAAWRLRRPVALVWDREESMFAHHKRHPMRIRCKWGANRDGKISAVEARVLADGGAYASTSAEVTKVATLFASGCYEIPNISVDGYAVYTNNIPSGAFRGFGAPQAQFAAEIMVARLAKALGLDEFEFRRRNIYREGSLEPTGQPLPEGVGALPVLERCEQEVRKRAQLDLEHPHASRSAPDLPYLRRGVGIASGIKNVGYSFGYPEQSTASVALYGRSELERAVVRIGAAEVGQGAHLAMRQIAAEALGLPVDQVELRAESSDDAPNAGSASASRMTLMGGRAVRDAALEARARWSGSEEYFTEATVQYRPPETTVLDPVTGVGRPNYCYGYTTQAVWVEVDTRTGQVQVQSIVSVHDVGRAINRQQVEGQIEGCLAQALGYTLLENFQIQNGRVLTRHFSTYLLPTILDMPTDVSPVVLELADPNGPYGARGVAEMALVPFAAAVASAIHDATGVWVRQLPMTPERVLAALRDQTTPRAGRSNLSRP
jgi:CO/xanthine dehydrogenase Mo-binding subunit